MSIQMAKSARCYTLFTVLLSLACGSATGSPDGSPRIPTVQTQAPPVPQEAAPMAAAPDRSVDGPESAPQRPAQRATPDTAMPQRETSEPTPMGMLDAAVRAPDAAMPAQELPPSAVACDPRKVDGPAGVFFHHIHFNTTDPNADLEFYEKYFDAMPVDFCTKPGGAPATRATRTERGYFLYTQVGTPPDPTLNAYLEHIGWCHPDPASELQRHVMLGAPLWPLNAERGQCDTAASGQLPCNNYWYYLQAPNGARVEVALGPGPATMGFGHIHVMMGEDLTWYEKITNGRYADTAIDMVNITDVLEDESYLAGEMVTDTHAKPIDHIGFSTSSLEAERDRIQAAGLEIAEEITFKPEYGFRSFFMKSAKGIWVEIVEDSAFAP